MLCCMLCMYNHAVRAQEVALAKRIDSLLNIINKTTDLHKKAMALKSITSAYSDINPTLGINYGNEGLKLAETGKWIDIKAHLYDNIAICYLSKGDCAKAIEHSLKALKIHESLGDTLEIIRDMGRLGQAYEENLNYPMALKYDSASLKLAVASNNKVMVGWSLDNLGLVFNELYEDEQALQCFQASLAIDRALCDTISIASSLCHIGICLQYQKKYFPAIANYRESLEIFQKSGKLGSIARRLGDIGICFLDMAKDSFLNVGTNQYPGNRSCLDSAYAYTLQSFNGHKNIGTIEGINATASCLADIEERRGNYHQALEYYKIYHSSYDSLYSNDNVVKIASLETQREADLKEKQIQINKLALAQKRKDRIIYLGGFALLGVTIVSLYKNARGQRKTNAIQAGALAQKEMLMKELHHRVKNNLQVISTLLELQQENVTDKGAKDAINESASRLRSILLIHQQLYTGDQLTEVECAQFASDLMIQIKAIFSYPGQTITFNNMQQVVLDVDTSIQVGLMLNEMITNSFKYAFPNADGTITLRIEKAGHQYKLYYTDSGPGLPDDLDINDTKNTGLGMMILESLSQQLGGSVQYNRNNKTFVIAFKDTEGNKREKTR